MRNSTDVSTVGRAGETVRYADVSIDYGKLMVCLTARSDFGSAASALINVWHAFSAYCVLFGNNIFGRYIEPPTYSAIIGSVKQQQTSRV